MILCPECNDKMGEETLKKHLDKYKIFLQKKTKQISDEKY